MNEISQTILRELFYYQDGDLYWKQARTGINFGASAGCMSGKGYRVIGVYDKMYLAHRLIFLYHHGYLPKSLDHIDGDPLNNSISNLREATNQQNSMNQKKAKSYNGKPTSSRFKGVHWDKRDKKRLAYIAIDGKGKYLGSFTSEIDAAKVYNTAAIKYYGEFARLNIFDEPNLSKTNHLKGEILSDEQRTDRSKAWKQAIVGDKFIYHERYHNTKEMIK